MREKERSLKTPTHRGAPFSVSHLFHHHKFPFFSCWASFSPLVSIIRYVTSCFSRGKERRLCRETMNKRHAPLCHIAKGRRTKIGNSKSPFWHKTPPLYVTQKEPETTTPKPTLIFITTLYIYFSIPLKISWPKNAAHKLFLNITNSSAHD